ncbi:large subunit GTPase 1 homolog [Ischnura elegans]|uniref:large subunit GTPase 1 homolog n=1 Tax=Ischnura elegans TaxID=197161 RepID=UPI001ED89EA7|nr:large subunit GTPase 1 homolog [Ischnura elegans]
MGKKKKDGNNLGRALIRDRFSGRKTGGNDSMLHTADIADGYDWGRLNLQSVTEESSFQEFLSTAELAGTEFQAEKLNIAFVSTVSQVGLLTDSEKSRIEDVQERNKQFLQIPRRPKWDADTTPEELHSSERDAFLDWRRKLALFQEENSNNGIILTPYEKNIEFWRQLWRVVEKSDIVVQIVDARNPLLFRCDDLERYVEEVALQQGHAKTNFILVNKADFLSQNQRELWAKFFNDQKIHMAFFSAIKPDLYDEALKEEDEEGDESADSENSGSDEDEVGVDKKPAESEGSTSMSESLGSGGPSPSNAPQPSTTQAEKTSPVSEKSEMAVKPSGTSMEEVEKNTGESQENSVQECGESDEEIRNSAKVLNRKELINLFKNLKISGPKNPANGGVRTVGLVGYPNVGKSSTINCLIEEKKVSVSATPGKTKHFQTLFVDSDLLLCDCPGLVMPSFVSTQAEMVLWGILPVDRLRDHVPSVSLLASLIPRVALEDQYGIMLPKPMEGEDPDRPPTSEELLNAYGYIRGFMTQRGLPDNPRTARYVLKDFINGKLLYCRAPPGHNQKDFHEFDSSKKKNKVSSATVTPQMRVVRGKVVAEELDKAFFRQATIGVHSKGVKPAGIGGSFPGPSPAGGSSANPAKPWKKHNNKNKREKLRRVYSHLDE